MESQLEGQQIGRYLVRQRLGGGGVATVYQALDQVSGQTVALKVLPPHPDAATLNRFRREALQAGALRHPNIMRILQVGTAADGESAYIAMDLVEGESLASLLSRLGQLPAEESCRLLEPIARALAYAHNQSVIHRDVKPSNILLRTLKGSPSAPADEGSVQLRELPYPIVPLISDFGIARFLDQGGADLTFTGQTVGTPAYMAPEQCMGSREVDGRADIYSLGTVLYRCVAGRLPFSGSTTQILHAQVFEPVVLDDAIVRALPANVVEMLRRALAKAPEDRYQSAEEFANDLSAAGRGADNRQTAGVNDGGSTMTLTQATAVIHPASTSVKVLVPGVTTLAQATRDAPASEPKKRKREPVLINLLWSLLFVVLVAALIWNVRTWYMRQQDQGSASLLPIHFVTFTPAAGTVSMRETPVVASASALTPDFAIIASTATSSPTPTPPPLPTATPLPTPAPTEARAVVEIATPTSEPIIEPTSEPTGVPTEIAIQPITGGEEVASTCLAVVNEFFSPKLQALPSDQQAEFACPTKDAKSVSAEWLTFEHGVMVAVKGDPSIYVYYENGAWEQVPPSEAADAPPVEGDRKEDALPRRFDLVLAAQDRAILLGEPTQPLARAETLLQPFNGGLILGNKETGQILLLARSKLRF